MIAILTSCLGNYVKIYLLQNHPFLQNHFKMCACIRCLEHGSKFNNQLMVRRCYILCGCKHKNSNCQNKVVSMLYKCSHIVGYKILRLSFEGNITILSKFWYITIFQATTLKICIVILPIKWWYLSCSTSMICLSMNRHVLWS